MKKYAAFIIAFFAIFISAVNVFAQAGFSGPSGGYGGYNGTQGQPVMISYPITVNEARNLPHDSWIVLTGNIVNMLPGGRQYTFRDATGDIAVDIGRKEWRGLTVGVSDKVEIYGEVKIHRGLLHIKVHAIKMAGV